MLSLLLGLSLPKVTKIPEQAKGKLKLNDLRATTRWEFSDDQKVVTVWKTGDIYTPNPRGAFTFLSIHFHLISVLLGP